MLLEIPLVSTQIHKTLPQPGTCDTTVVREEPESGASGGPAGPRGYHEVTGEAGHSREERKFLLGQHARPKDAVKTSDHQRAAPEHNRSTLLAELRQRRTLNLNHGQIVSTNYIFAVKIRTFHFTYSSPSPCATLTLGKVYFVFWRSEC